MKVLFVGKPLHGTHVDVPLAQPLESLDADHKLPDSYVHVPSGVEFLLETVYLPAPPHPLTGQPDGSYRRQIYLRKELLGNVETANAALQDACARAWFLGGTHVQEQPPTSTVDDIPPWYIAHCEGCGHDLPFTSLLARAKWATAHGAETDHKITFWTEGRAAEQHQWNPVTATEGNGNGS